MTMSITLKECRRILGVGENAGIKELRKAFHVRASLFHPDVRRSDPGADEEFKRITTAYHYLKKEILKENKEKKIAGELPKPARKAKPRAAKAPAAKPPEKVAKLPASSVPLDELVYRLRFSQNRYVRIHAIREIAGQGGKSALWWIIGALKDADEEVRRTAVQALGEIGSAVAVVPLRELHRRADTFIRDEIEIAVKKIEQNTRKISKPQPQTAS